MYRLTSVATLFSGILFGMVLILGQFAADVQLHLVFTALFLYCAVFLVKCRRWAAWFTFFVSLVGMIATLFGVNGGGVVSNELLYAAAMMSGITAICAFVILWPSKVAAAAV